MQRMVFKFELRLGGTLVGAFYVPRKVHAAFIYDCFFILDGWWIYDPTT